MPEEKNDTPKSTRHVQEGYQGRGELFKKGYSGGQEPIDLTNVEPPDSGTAASSAPADETSQSDSSAPSESADTDSD